MPAVLGVSRRRVMRRNELQSIAIPAIDIAESGVADVDSLLQHGCKYWLEVTRRATDDLKDLRRGRLLL